MKIGNETVCIIAEVGSNHNGDLAIAFELIDIAAECDADIVKFQSFLVDELLAAGDPNYERLRKLELPRDWYPKLIERCRLRGVSFLSTATNFVTLDWMEELQVEGYKVASGNITHRPLLDKLIAIGKPVIVSTGLADFDEIVALERHFISSGLKQFAFLHCVARYPVPVSDLSLGNIPILKRKLSCPVGFSDHSLGIEGPIAAVALGARIVEKHISLNGTGIGMDHEVAATPDIFRSMCAGIRGVERALGSNFRPDPSNVFQLRRSLHFARPMKKGETIRPEDIKVNRPEDGVKPDQLPYVLSRTVSRDVAKDQPVLPDVVDGGIS